MQCKKGKCKVNAKTRESTLRFTEIRSQRVIYVLPRPPQDLLPLLAINNYNVGANFEVLSSLRTYHKILPRGFVQDPLNFLSVFVQVHSNLQEKE